MNVFSGVNVTVPSGATVYVPSPSTTTGSVVGFPVFGSINFAGAFSSISTVFSTPLIVVFPPTNSGFPVWGAPWISLDFAGFAVGVTPLTLGVYLASTGVPFASFTWTDTPVATPVNSGFGVNVTSPVVGLTEYVPSSAVTESTGLPSRSISFAGCAALIVIGTSVFPGLNTGVPFCSAPWISSDVTSSPVGLTGVTVGVYLALAGVPFSSKRWTSIPVAFPVNCGSGWNLILPFGSIVYVPSPSTVTDSTGLPETGSINFVEVSTIGTLESPAVNVGVPNWAFPCISVVLAGVAVGLIGVIFGV